MASISGSVTIFGDPDDWIACAFDAATHAFAGVAAVSAGAYEITGLTAGKAYVVACRPKSGAAWQADYPLYDVGHYCVPADPVTTPYLFKATDANPGDLNFDSNALLLPMDGDNDGTTFTDVMGKTVTATTVVTKTATKKYGTASAYFPGAPSYLTVTASSDFLWDSSQDWTVEWWMYWPSTSTNTLAKIIDGRSTGTSTALEIVANGSTSLIYLNHNATKVAQSASVPRNAWVHVALVRNGGSVKFYIDGTGGGTVWNSPGSSIGNASDPLYIGDAYPAARGGVTRYEGYIDDLRITKGIARYTADFTAPEAAHLTYAGDPSGSTEPTWPTTPGQTVVDGGVTWENMGQLVQPLMQGPLIAA